MRRYQDILLVTINPGLAIVGVLPGASPDVFYTATLRGYGGIAPYDWAIVGGVLPTGYSTSTDSNGDFVISGTTSEIGDFLFTVLLRDSSGKSVTKRFSLRVVAEPLSIVGDAPNGDVGVPYSYDYAITGGVPPYFPYLEIGGGFGPLPDGLTLTQPSTNVLRIEGTPTAGQLNVTFKIAANDSQWPAAYAYVVDTMSIVPDDVSVAGTFLDTDIGDPLNGSPLAISGGIPPYSLSGSPYSGTRPDGVSIAVVGDEVIATGNTTTVASYSWTERVMDSMGDHFDVVSSITVSSYPPLAVTGTFSGSVVGSPLGGTPLPITGGDGSYSLSGSPHSGTRPPGVSFSVVGSNLVASGNTTTAGSYSWTERVLSGDGQHFDVASSVVVTEYITWNPADHVGSNPLTNADKTLNGGSGAAASRATKPKAAGKWYWECVVPTSPVNSGVRYGVEPTGGSTPTTMGNAAGAVAFAGTGFRYLTGATTGAVASPVPSAGQRMMFAWNATTGEWWIGCNGTWLFGGDPAAGTTPAMTGVTGTRHASASLPNGAVRSITIAADPADCLYAAPAGFVNWNG